MRQLLAVMVAASSIFTTPISVLSVPQVETQPTLSEGGRIDLSLTPGTTRGVRFSLAADHALRATVTSTAALTRLQVMDPGGRAIREMVLNVQGGSVRPDSLTLVATSAGEYRFELQPANKDAGETVTVAIDRIAPADEGDRRRAHAEQTFWEAFAVNARRGIDNARRALELYQSILSDWRTLGDPWFEASTLQEMGGIHRLQGENDQALRYFEQALPLFKVSGIPRPIAATLSNIGNIHSSRGDMRKAVEAFDQSLAVVRGAGDRQAQAILLNNIGTLYQALGDLQTALDYYIQSLALRRAVRDRAGETRTLNNLSLMYRLLGDFAASKQAADQALALATELDDPSLLAPSLNTLGTIERLLGELGPAQKHLEEALVLFRQVGERRLMSATLNNLGELHLAEKRVDRARLAFDEALKEAQTSVERLREAYTLRNLGTLASAGGEHDAALRQFELALEIERMIRNQEGEAESLRAIARTLMAQGQFELARERSQAALALIESLRSKVASVQLRTSYFSSKRPYYELHVDLLMRQGAASRSSADAAARAALEVSERARARSLVDLLRESGIAIREGVDAELLAREESIRERINTVESSRVRALAGKPDPQQLAGLQKQLDALLLEYQQAEAEMRARSPRYAAISQGQTASVAEIQRALDGETVLLEYLLGDERSYVWAVTSSDVSGYELPGRAAIEAAARELYAALTRETRRPNDPALDTARTALSQIVLGPVAANLRKPRVIVVADGALLYVPFSLLDAPITGETTTLAPLIAAHEVVHLPSMSSLLAMRSAPATVPAAAPSVAIIADPVFAADDARVKAALTRRSTPSTSATASESTGPETLPPGTRSVRVALERSAGDTGIITFPRLRFTREEADAVARLLPSDRRFMALDFAASRATATSESFGRHRILHFATHGLINSVHPELSGLVFSLVDSRGEPQEGFLRLHDIYNLRLDSDLVVLSACQTALGKDMRGEGLIGLTRGFMYAGAPRIVASLWDVEDRATAELMRRFYEGVLQRGQPAAAALREAQLALMRDRRWAHPYYWGGFILQGEWR